MSKRDRKALREYIRWIANEIELRDWTIELLRAPCAEDQSGQAHCLPGQRHVQISVAANFREHTPEEQREIIVHELIHAHTAGTWHMVQSDLADPLGKLVYYVFCDSYRRSMEYATDALSKALARHLPLIAWPKR